MRRIATGREDDGTIVSADPADANPAGDASVRARTRSGYLAVYLHSHSHSHPALTLTPDTDTHTLYSHTTHTVYAHPILTRYSHPTLITLGGRLTWPPDTPRVSARASRNLRACLAHRTRGTNPRTI